MPGERKPPVSWFWRVLLILILFPSVFYVSYLWNTPFSLQELRGPFVVAGILVTVDGVFQLLFRKRRMSSEKTDWPERICDSLLLTLFISGFLWCAELAGETTTQTQSASPCALLW
jgi:hypothetical protein